MSNKKWLINKTPRSVDQLRLWSNNPRLNPEHEYITLRDFVDELTSDDSEKKDFLKLIRAISEDGFIPLDPIVVWKGTNDKYYVAEGNRRIIALKLLRDPEKAPKSIRSIIRKCAFKIKASDIKKVYVNVAPSFDDAEWYISQRNSASSLQRKWSNEQQKRWVEDLYKKHGGDTDRLTSVTKLTKSDLESTIRLLQIKDYIKLPKVRTHLTDDEFDLAKSHRFKISILERFFNLTDAREAWGVEYDGFDVKIISNKQSFYKAFAELIRKIIGQNDDVNNGGISTRFTKDDLSTILDGLPHVSFEDADIDNIESDSNEDAIEESEGGNIGGLTTTPPVNNNIRGNNDRARLIPDNCVLNTGNQKLRQLFGELKKLPFSRKHSISVVLRVFFDLSVAEYIDSEDIGGAIKKQFDKEPKHIILKKKLEYIKTNQSLNQDSERIIKKLLNPDNSHYTLDTLNGYIHGTQTHYSTKPFLNGFWDFLYPLFESLLDITEK